MAKGPGVAWDDEDLIGGADTNADAGLILAEEAALREYLSGITVPEFSRGQQTSKRVQVPVYYRWPTSERTITYPYITIDLLSIDPAYARWHSWTNPMKDGALYWDPASPNHQHVERYYPDMARDIKPSSPDTFGFHTGPYLPYDLMFQISVFSRSIHHDRYLTSRMFVDFLSQRNFWIDTEIDGVFHRCELLGWVSGDSMETMEATKRQFRKIYTLRMETEVPSEKLYELRKVRRVNVKFFDQEDYLVDEFTIPEEVTP